MELARGNEQGRSGMHDSSPYRHESKRPQHSKQATLALESARAHTWNEQQRRIRCPSAQLADEGRNGELNPPRVQEPSGEYPGLASGGTQKALHQVRHLNAGDHVVGQHCPHP